MHSAPQTSDYLSVDSIRGFLKKSCKLNVLQLYPQLASTNTTAKQLAQEGAPHGTVILAEHQTAGKGRLGRSFYSPDAKGIYLSVVLRLNERTDISLLTTSASAVAVCRAIKTVTGLESQIKWVNDVYIAGRKVCGILTEASMDFATGQLAYLILGIGINVSQAEFPDELKPIVTALSEHTDTPIDRNHLIGALLNELDFVLSSLSERTFLEEYRTRSFLLDKHIYVIRQKDKIPAVAKAINDDGHLIVETEDGTVCTLSSGEVSIRLQ